MLIENDFTW